MARNQPKFTHHFDNLTCESQIGLDFRVLSSSFLGIHIPKGRHRLEYNMDYRIKNLKRANYLNPSFTAFLFH
jgi:hypothetical protein